MKYIKITTVRENGSNYKVGIQMIDFEKGMMKTMVNPL